MIFPLYAIAGLLIGQVAAQAGLSPCAAGCVDGVLADSSKVGCPTGDVACVCSKADSLTSGVHDCVAQACASEGPDQITLAQTSAQQRCAAVANPAPAPAPSPAPSPSPSPAPSPTSEQDTTQTLTSTVMNGESTTPVASTPTSESSTHASPTTTGSSTASHTSSATHSGAGAVQTGAADDAENDSPSGLSVAAKAGIGAGVGVALVMTAIVAICLTVRRKQQEKDARRGPIEISGPLPGGGRQWAGGEPKYGSAAPAGSATRGSYSSELENHARRYEEMVPHTKPHTMI